MLLRAPRCGQQIHKECQDIKGEDERDDPFEDGRYILPVIKRGADEDGSKGNFDEDKGEFKPEGEAQDAVLTEVYAQALVLGADEDGADDVTGHKEEEETIVQMGMVEGIEDGEEDQAAGSGDGEDDCGDRKGVSAWRRVRSRRWAETYWTGRKELSPPGPNSWLSGLCAVASARTRRRGRGRRW